MNRLASGLGLAAVALVFCGCTDLADIRAGVCGNGVVEGKEDCDGSPGCNPAGKAGACRLACETAAECPSGWRCGSDAICREPTGEFEAVVTIPTSDQMEVAVGELNGARPADLVSIGPNGEIVVRYGGGGLQETSTFRSEPILPAIGKLSKDQTDDIAHATTRALGVLLGSPPKGLRPMAYAPFAVGDTEARFVITEGRRPAGPDDFVYQLDEIVEISKSKIIDALDPNRAVIATMPFDVSELTPGIDAALPVGDLDTSPDSPCSELVLAKGGASEVVIYSLCKANGLEWNGNLGALPTVKLPAGAEVSLGSALGDIDGDEKLDLVILGPKKPQSAEVPLYSVFVAFGAGDGTFNSTPLPVPGAVDNMASPIGISAPALPLAMGDLNGDGRADFVLPNAFIWSNADCSSGTQSCFDLSERFFDLKAARIADLNGNGLKDLVAIVDGSRTLYFFNGNKTNLPTPYEIPIEGDPTGLALGDFDGDLVGDVAVAQRVGEVISVDRATKGDTIVSSDGGNVFTVAFGQLQGPPSPPQRMGELGRIDTMAAGNLAIRGLDVMTDVGVIGLDQAETPSVAIFSGASNRQLQAPFDLALGSEVPDAPAAVQVGRFDGDGAQHDIAVIGAFNKKKRLWLVPTTGDAVLSVNTTFASPLPDDLDPCGSFMVPLDVDGDQQDELYIVGRRKLPKTGTQIIVARAGDGKWNIDPPVVFDDFAVVPHIIRYIYCRDTISEFNVPDVSDIVDSQASQFGDVEVADLDGEGAPELVLLSFKSTEDESFPFESKLVVFRGGGLGAGERIDLELPPDRHPFSFTLLNADADPEPEIAYFSPQGIFVADLDLEARKLTDIVVLMDPFRAQTVSASFEDSPPLNIVAGDFNGDGINDIAMAYQLATDIYYGRPVNP